MVISRQDDGCGDEKTINSWWRQLPFRNRVMIQKTHSYFSRLSVTSFGAKTKIQLQPRNRIRQTSVQTGKIFIYTFYSPSWQQTYTHMQTTSTYTQCKQELWPPGSADTVCPRRPLMTLVQHWAKTAHTDHVTLRP